VYLKEPRTARKTYLFCPKKGAANGEYKLDWTEVPDLMRWKIFKTWGFSGQFHIKSMLLGLDKYIYGRFGGHMDTKAHQCNLEGSECG